MRTERFQTTLKRLWDVLLAATGLLVCLPLMGLIAIVIRCQMGRPVLFRQLRAGKGGRCFVLYKFRTMRSDCDADGKLKNSVERVTPLGRFLRRLSLDELPQLWNVLRGDMSLVGPRPLLPEYLPRYTPQQARRHEVLPGLTGWAQINGRNAISWEEKFALDVWYVEHWNIVLDLYILVLTAIKAFQGGGVNAPGQYTMPEFLPNEAPLREAA